MINLFRLRNLTSALSISFAVNRPCDALPTSTRDKLRHFAQRLTPTAPLHALLTRWITHTLTTSLAFRHASILKHNVEIFHWHNSLCMHEYMYVNMYVCVCMYGRWMYVFNVMECNVRKYIYILCTVYLSMYLCFYLCR